ASAHLGGVVRGAPAGGVLRAGRRGGRPACHVACGRRARTGRRYVSALSARSAGVPRRRRAPARRAVACPAPPPPPPPARPPTAPRRAAHLGASPGGPARPCRSHETRG